MSDDTSNDDALSSIDDTLGAVFDAAERGESAEPVADATIAPESAALAEKSDSERARDEAGRFAKAAAEGAPAEGTTAPVEAAAPAEAQKPVKPRPVSYKAQEVPWEALPAAAQDAWIARDAEVEAGFQSRAGKLREYEAVEKTLAPYRQSMQLAGVTPDQAIGKLMAAQEFLQRDPVSALHWLARSAGLDLSQVAQMQPGQVMPAQPAQQPVDVESAARAAVERMHLEKTLQDFLSHPDRAAVVNEQRVLPDGTVEYPFRTAMAAIMQAGIAPDLETAFEAVRWARRDLRDAEIAKLKAAARSEVEAERTRKAKEAQRAAAINVKPKAAPRLVPKAGSIDDTLAATYDRVSAA